MVSLHGKTRPRVSGILNEESCEAERGIVAVPVVVEPVPVQHHLAIVLDEVRHVQVAVAVPDDMCKVPSMPPAIEYSPA